MWYRAIGYSKKICALQFYFFTFQDAVRCISETNNITYKGQPLKVKFEDGSLEDTEQFRRQYLDLFHNYPNELIPSTTTTTATLTNSQNNLPIGVLPSSSSLGAFGALPDVAALTSIIESVRRASQGSSQPPVTSTNTPVTSVAPTSYPSSNLTGADPMYMTDVDGQIHAVSSKIVLIRYILSTFQKKLIQ